ncbi:aminopeptidase P family protein [Acetobacteraceae bacterium KSS8]|uniref:Aminopeptidase P family protein n=1 Tax=Endosaccharibacter trunci TaxID=2812733 RepID=A0ABT1W4R2_9PROT|nr:aminopeptidase P family protein [Acetobacteraceae bacterium KSS8]
MMHGAEKLAALRAVLAGDELDGFVLPRGDEHLGEYVAPYAERLAWLTGFTGSAGMVVVLSDRAAVFSDGRYVLQLAAQTDPACFEREHITETPPEDWLAAALRGGEGEKRIGYDPWLLSQDVLARFNKHGFRMVPVARNPVDAIWHDRPAPPLLPAVPHPMEFAGRESSEKRQEIAAILRAAGQDAAVLTDPASVNWLFNIRGRDVGFTPFALGFAVLESDGSAILFMAPEKIDDALLAWLGDGVSVRPPDALASVLAGYAGRVVRIDPSASAVWFAQTLREAGATVSPGADPCALPKARKNAAEQAGFRRAHALDAMALCGFLQFVAEHGVGLTETELSQHLDRFRARSAEYRGESFPAISGTGPNGAIIHYRADPATARRLGPDEVYLIDSGGQYASGTTDVTRTLWSGPGPAPAELRERVTRVLKGHIALSRARFPQGVHGGRLDALARTALWQAGLDYDHGTGHGVGSCLSVHEGPCGISPAARPVPIEAGMVLSNEPGFYAAGAYGIRLENLVLVVPQPVGQSKPFLGFEPLTLVPFDRALFDVALLDETERDWIDSYHRLVLERIGPLVDDANRPWLEAACAPLELNDPV